MCSPRSKQHGLSSNLGLWLNQAVGRSRRRGGVGAVWVWVVRSSAGWRCSWVRRWSAVQPLLVVVLPLLLLLVSIVVVPLPCSCSCSCCCSSSTRSCSCFCCPFSSCSTCLLPAPPPPSAPPGEFRLMPALQGWRSRLGWGTWCVPATHSGRHTHTPMFCGAASASIFVNAPADPIRLACDNGESAPGHVCRHRPEWRARGRARRLERLACCNVASGRCPEWRILVCGPRQVNSRQGRLSELRAEAELHGGEPAVSLPLSLLVFKAFPLYGRLQRRFHWLDTSSMPTSPTAHALPPTAFPQPHLGSRGWRHPMQLTAARRRLRSTSGTSTGGGSSGSSECATACLSLPF